jgi:hypothetical protein
MANPGSQYSISTQEEMEMDYYDYNVVNASAAPGSYLGMDPAFLVWIPPIDEHNGIISDLEGDEILPVNRDLDPGSNQESPESGDSSPLKIPTKPPRRSLISPSSDDSPGISPRDILRKINFLQKNAASEENLQHRSPPKIASDIKRISVIEKETSVIKSPSDNRICEYYELSDIKFADDDLDEDCANTTTTTTMCK